MRKTSYVVTFFAVVLSLILNTLSARRPDWLVVISPEILHTQITVQYGLSERCELEVVDVPGQPGDGRLEYTNYTCRKFPTPVSDSCEKENRVFCTSWTSAGYATELAIGFAALSLVTIVIGVSTHSRRRRIWRAVAGLVILHTLLQIMAFGIVTEMYRTSSYPSFEQARPGAAYVLNVLSWILGVAIAFGVITTGISADKGHRWAAGNRAYHPIAG